MNKWILFVIEAFGKIAGSLISYKSTSARDVMQKAKDDNKTLDERLAKDRENDKKI